MVPLLLAFLSTFLWQQAAHHSQCTPCSLYLCILAQDVLSTPLWPVPSCLPIRNGLGVTSSGPLCPPLAGSGGFPLSGSTPGSVFIPWSRLSALLDCGLPEDEPSPVAFSLSLGGHPASPPHLPVSIFSCTEWEGEPSANDSWLPPEGEGLTGAGSEGDALGHSLPRRPGNELGGRFCAQ